MPRLKVNEGAEQEKTICGRERDDDIAERCIGLNEVPKAAPAIESMGDSHVDRVSRAPQGDDVTYTKQEYGDTVSHLGALRTISERANGDDEEDGDVQLENNIKDDPTGTIQVHEREGIFTRVLCCRLNQLKRFHPKLVNNSMAAAHHRVLTKKKAR